MNLPEHLDADACETLGSWVLGQIASWHADPPTVDLAEEFERLNATTPTVFILDITRFAVGIRQKPAAACNANYGVAFDRINDYRSWIADVVADYHPDMCIALAVYVGDYGALANPRVPVFAFQKPSANRSLLLPDVDLIKQGVAKPDDGLAYRDKACHAIFAGSTTGVWPLTAEAVRRDGGIPRILAALYFRGSPDVTFKLPNVVQYESVEAVELLRGRDVGVGARIDWPTQLRSGNRARQQLGADEIRLGLAALLLSRPAPLAALRPDHVA